MIPSPVMSDDVDDYPLGWPTYSSPHLSTRMDLVTTYSYVRCVLDVLV